MSKKLTSYEYIAPEDPSFPDPNLQLFLGCLPTDSDPLSLSVLFNQYCTRVASAKIKFRKEGVCAGFGFLECVATETQRNTILNKSRIRYKGRLIDIQLYQSHGELKRSREDIYKRKLLISNIPPKVTERDLTRFFKKFGSIERAYLGQKSKKSTWRSGFVVFNDQRAIKLVKSKDFIEFKGSRLIISQVGKKKLGGECTSFGEETFYAPKTEGSGDLYRGQGLDQNSSNSQFKFDRNSYYAHDQEQTDHRAGEFHHPVITNTRNIAEWAPENSSGLGHLNKKYPKNSQFSFIKYVDKMNHQQGLHSQRPSEPSLINSRMPDGGPNQWIGLRGNFCFYKLNFSQHPKRLNCVKANHYPSNLRFNNAAKLKKGKRNPGY